MKHKEVLKLYDRLESTLYGAQVTLGDGLHSINVWGYDGPHRPDEKRMVDRMMLAIEEVNSLRADLNKLREGK